MKCMHSSEIQWQLSEEEKDDILVNWLKNTIKKSDLIIEEFFNKK